MSVRQLACSMFDSTGQWLEGENKQIVSTLVLKDDATFELLLQMNLLLLVAKLLAIWFDAANHSPGSTEKKHCALDSDGDGCFDGSRCLSLQYLRKLA